MRGIILQAQIRSGRIFTFQGEMISYRTSVSLLGKLTNSKMIKDNIMEGAVATFMNPLVIVQKNLEIYDFV